MEWHADKPHNLALERALSMASSNRQQQLTAGHTHHMHVCFEPPKTETTSNKRRQNRYGDRLTLVTSSPAPQVRLQNGQRKHKLNNAHNAPRTAGGLLCGRNIPFASSDTHTVHRVQPGWEYTYYRVACVWVSNFIRQQHTKLTQP